MLIHWANDFSLIIPKEIGIQWQHQTAGVMCNQIFIEGIMIPLDRPKDEQWVDYLDKLTDANYRCKVVEDPSNSLCPNKEIKRIWQKINEYLPFSYKTIEAPDKQPTNQEGIQWIVIQKIKYPKRKDRRKISRIIHRRDCKTLDEQYKDLIGKKIALIYPNCD